MLTPIPNFALNSQGVMIKSEKIKKLSSILDRNDAVLIAEALRLLREEEPFEGTIELLATHYDKNSGVIVNKAIESFMNDLKDKSLRAEVMKEIKATHKPETITMLVSSCWQSGLDYSSFCTDLTDIFLNNGYGIALECMTVIEESIPVLTLKEKKAIASKLRNGTTDESGAKKALALDLISMLGE
jgi:predicted DNA-binding protein